MSHSLRERWQKQLSLVEADSSWRARVEVRVLRFLLARYEWKEEEAPLADFPLYEGGAQHGRTRALLSSQEQAKRLEHIASENLERMEVPPLVSDDFFERGAWLDLQRRRKSEAFRRFGQKVPYPAQPEYYLPQWLKWLEFDVGEWTFALITRLLPRRYSASFPKAVLDFWLRIALGVRFFAQMVSSRR